jgi:hypothetical protein
MYDFNMETEEAGNHTAEYWESRPDYAEVMAEMAALLPDVPDCGDVPNESDVWDYEDVTWEGYFQEEYEPSPYGGTY